MGRQRTLVEETTGYSVGSKDSPQIQSVWAGRLLEEGCWENLEGPVRASQIKWGRSGGLCRAIQGRNLHVQRQQRPSGAVRGLVCGVHCKIIEEGKGQRWSWAGSTRCEMG